MCIFDSLKPSTSSSKVDNSNSATATNRPWGLEEGLNRECGFLTCLCVIWQPGEGAERDDWMRLKILVTTTTKGENSACVWEYSPYPIHVEATCCFWDFNPLGCIAQRFWVPAKIGHYCALTGGVTGRPETMYPRTNVLGPLVSKLNAPCDMMSLDWYIPVIMHFTIRICDAICQRCISPGTLCFWDA